MEVLGDSAGSPEALVQPSCTLPSHSEAHAGRAAFWHLPVAAQKGLERSLPSAGPRRSCQPESHRSPAMHGQRLSLCVSRSWLLSPLLPDVPVPPAPAEVLTAKVTALRVWQAGSGRGPGWLGSPHPWEPG